MPEKCRFPSKLFGADIALVETTCRIVNHLEMPLKTVANVEAFETEITLKAAFRLIAAVLIGENLFAAGDVVCGVGGGR